MATGDFVLTAAQIKRAAQLYESGYSLRQVAGRFQVSQMAAKNAVLFAGVKLRERHEARRMRWTAPELTAGPRVTARWVRSIEEHHEQ